LRLRDADVDRLGVDLGGHSHTVGVVAASKTPAGKQLALVQAALRDPSLEWTGVSLMSN
jgi:hypothetical protein